MFIYIFVCFNQNLFMMLKFVNNMCLCCWFFFLRRNVYNFIYIIQARRQKEWQTMEKNICPVCVLRILIVIHGLVGEAFAVHESTSISLCLVCKNVTATFTVGFIHQWGDMTFEVNIENYHWITILDKMWRGSTVDPTGPMVWWQDKC